MANDYAIIAIIGCFALGLLSGCVDGSATAGSEDRTGQSDAAHEPPSAKDEHEPQSTLPLNWTRTLSFVGCDYATFSLSAATENFPFTSPPGWEETGIDLEEVVVGRMWACQEASVLGVQTFRNVSMLWLGHGNVSDSEGRLDEYRYDDLAAEIVITAHPPEFADVLNGGVDVRPGQVIIENGIVVMQNPEGRIVVELTRVPYPGSAIIRETAFFISGAGDMWMKLEQAHDSDGVWLHGTVSTEGQTPLDPWFNEVHSIPVADGYLALNGTIGVTAFD